jgi:very-short-patch-repair endonuclease
VISLLRELALATLQVGGDGGEDRATQLARLEKDSNELEKTFLQFLHEHGYQLPQVAQQIVEDFYVRPDFVFHTPGGDVAIFIDGPIHDSDHQASRDKAAQARLEDEGGWLVLRFHHEDNRTAACGDQPSWREVVANHPAVFGPGKIGS